MSDNLMCKLGWSLSGEPAFEAYKNRFFEEFLRKETNI